MSHRNAFLSACLVVTCCVLSTSGQQPAASASSRSNVVVPPLVNFSGVLTNINGKPLTNITGVTFLLYKEEQGGAPLWLETQNVQPDKNGHYTVMLGSTTSTGLPADIFVAGEARWLGVQPQGLAEQPRILLLSVPYALKAADAQTIGGLPPSAFVLAAPSTASSAGAASPSAVAQPLAPGTTPVTTAGGTINKLAKFDATADITSSQVFDNGTNVGIGNTAPGAKLDVSGGAIVRGLLNLPATGTATATAGKNSQPIGWVASAFNSGTATPVNQTFRWQAEPAGNNTATTSGTLNLLYATGTATPAETGLKIASNGRFTFAAGQTFPGTVTSVLAGTDLTRLVSGSTTTLSLNTTATDARYAQLGTANTFTGNQAVTGGITATGTISGTLSGNGAAVTGVNAALLGGLAPGAFALLSAANTFVGNQNIAGSLSVNSPAGTVVQGVVSGTSGAGVVGFAASGTGTGIGTVGLANSATGIAGLFDNSAAGGDILLGNSGGVQKFLVDTSGNVTASGKFSGNGSGLTNVNASNVASGTTLRGNYGIEVNAAAGGARGISTFSFGFALASAPAANFIAAGGASTTNCPGSSGSPQALPGQLCVYESYTTNVGSRCVVRTGANYACGVADPWGAGLFLTSTAAGTTVSVGSWAVTVP